MAFGPAHLFFRKNRTYGVGSLTFDLLLSENHSGTNTVSNHPIEDGSIISDHIQTKSATGSVTGLVTNFSINAGIITSNSAQDAFNLLEELRIARELVTITTVMKVYNNVAITSTSVNRDAATGEAITLDISFQESDIVTLAAVTITANVTNMNEALNRQAGTDVDIGRVTP